MGISRFLLLCFILVIVGCESSQKNEFTPYDFELRTFDWDNNPYKFSSFIQDSILSTKGPQYSAWEYSYIGDIENTLKIWDSNANPRKEITEAEKAAFEKFRKQDAISYITSRADSHQIVIINEAHHIPQHRVFTTQLLQKLYDQGYRHLGMESYFNSKKTDSLLLVNKYPTLKSGFYTKEPQFGNLVREAVKIGYYIFGYESGGHENSKEREINQANNIKEYLAQYPNDKMLIHCGFAHAMEGDYGGSWGKTMAGRLTEFTGINPLTINQTDYSEKSSRALENPYYQLVDVEKTSVYVNETNEPFGKYKEGAWFDISVFHPRTKQFNRPEWLIYGDRKIEEIDFEDSTIECPCLVFAYVEGEEIGSAVPYDIIETLDKKVKLLLAPNEYNIVVWNREGEAWLTAYKSK